MFKGFYSKCRQIAHKQAIFYSKKTLGRARQELKGKYFGFVANLGILKSRLSSKNGGFLSKIPFFGH